MRTTFGTQHIWDNITKAILDIIIYMMRMTMPQPPLPDSEGINLRMV